MASMPGTPDEVIQAALYKVGRLCKTASNWDWYWMPSAHDQMIVAELPLEQVRIESTHRGVYIRVWVAGQELSNYLRLRDEFDIQDVRNFVFEKIDKIEYEQNKAYEAGQMAELEKVRQWVGPVSTLEKFGPAFMLPPSTKRRRFWSLHDWPFKLAIGLFMSVVFYWLYIWATS